MTRTVWLASYPKSGNTWFRLLLANLGRDTPADINAIPLHATMASGRHRFDAATLFPSGLLTHEECARLRPRVHAALAEADDEPADLAGIRFAKTHDAWTYTPGGAPLLGGRAGADAAILIVRDPRAVVPSLASHFGITSDVAIDFLGNPQAYFCGERDRQQPQLRQWLRGWSEFHRGWLGQRELPVHLVRYEALAADAATTLAEALAFLGVAVDPADCARAARFADFGELRRQERKGGFREAPRRHAVAFFRDGTPDGWRTVLDTVQLRRIETDHAAMMERLGYPPAALERKRLAG